MSTPVTKEFLDDFTANGCSIEGCEHYHATLYLHPKCHMGGRIEVSYRNGSGLLRINCKECGREVAVIKVADEETP